MLEKAKKRVDKILEWILIALMAANVLNVLWQVFTRGRVSKIATALVGGDQIGR